MCKGGGFFHFQQGNQNTENKKDFLFISVPLLNILEFQCGKVMKYPSIGVKVLTQFFPGTFFTSFTYFSADPL